MQISKNKIQKIENNAKREVEHLEKIIHHIFLINAKNNV